MKIIEIPIGTVVIHEDKKLKIVESDDSSCRKCYFSGIFCCPGVNYVVCTANDRRDRKEVHFEEVKE